jgi:hypothetical protein
VTEGHERGGRVGGKKRGNTQVEKGVKSREEGRREEGKGGREARNRVGPMSSHHEEQHYRN